MINPNSLLSSLITCCVCLVISVTPSVVIAQTASAQPDPVKTKAADEEIRIYRLEYIESDLAVDIVLTILDNEVGRIAEDENTNSLIVQATDSGHQSLGTLLKSLDQPKPSQDKIRIIPSGRLDTSVIGRMLPFVEIATSGSNTVLKGTPEDLEAAETLAMQLMGDKEKKADTQSLLMEALWLQESDEVIRGLADSKLAEKLRARGFDSLLTVAALETRINSTGQFVSESIQAGTTLALEGIIRPTDQGLEVNLQIQASSAPVIDLNFKSTYVAKADQWLVFGVAQGASGDGRQQQGRNLILVRIKTDSPL
ncbi:MAG: secretin N-terminal domain-containing protein [Planctomycetota bacterium]